MEADQLTHDEVMRQLSILAEADVATMQAEPASTAKTESEAF